MRSTIQALFSDVAGHTRRKIGGIYAVLLVFNLSAWVWAFVAFRHYPALVGTAFLAYSLGLRHAVDADRDEGVALQDVHHLEAGFVVVENGLVAKAFQLRELTAVGGKHG